MTLGDFIKNHPTVKAVQRRRLLNPTPMKLSHEELRRWTLAAGADDVGIVSLESEALGPEAAIIKAAFPSARAVMSLVVRLNREPIRNPARSVANLEFHQVTDFIDEVSRRVVSEMERRGIPALNPASSFPMEVDNYPSRMWLVAHKTVAVAAGLGHMGLHRNLIHPRFGNFVLLGTVILGAELDHYDSPLGFNPCLQCKLCVASCPVGAISPDGRFNALDCMTHTYREFLGGFNDWVGEIADSEDRTDYARRISPAESVSMWQSLSTGANNKSAYCLAVCPAGEDVITPFLRSRRQFTEDVLRPLQHKSENVYVRPGSKAEEMVHIRFPNKRPRRVHS